MFRGVTSCKAILVIASGVNRVDAGLLAVLCGQDVTQANPDFVRSATGFAIGGVPPVGFEHPIETWIDQDLLAFTEVWAAAGTPFTVFAISPASLPGLTGGKVARVCQT